MRTTLHGMLLRGFLPVFLIALTFFVTILELVDIFQNITRYIDLEVPFSEVLRVQPLFAKEPALRAAYVAPLCCSVRAGDAVRE
jgi:lipopolysaccharide export system permease protein